MARFYILLFVLVILGGIGYGAYFIYNDTMQRMATLRDNNAKLEVAHEENQATIQKMTEDAIRLNALTDQLNADLRKSEQYGDELRETLNKHNLTHLANKKPGLIENRMQDKTDALWKDLESITGATPSE